VSEVRIKLTADVAQANTGLKSVQQNLAATAASAVKADSSLQKLGNGSNQAGNALTNLSRVVQDAPFGFIGIQNNINPLLESFQRLKVETGSTGGALKALAGSLAGGAGLGLAVSAATTALTLLAQSGFFSAGKEANKAAEEAKKYKDEVKGITESAAKEQANVLILVKALESENTSRREKKAALEELQQINPKYFGDLKIENDLIIGLSAAYEKYKNSIIAAIQNKIDEKKLEAVLEKINTATEQQQQNQVFVKINQERINQLYKAGGAEYARQLEFQNENLNNTSKLNKLERERDEILKRIADRNFEGEIDLKTEKAKKEAETIQSVLSKLAREIDFLNTKEIVFNTNETKNKVKEIESTIEKLIRDFKVSPKDSIIQKLFGQGLLIDASFVEGIDKLKSSLQEKIGGDPIKIPAAIDVKDALDKARKDAAAELGRNPLVKPIKLPFKTDDIFKEQEQRLRQFIGSATDEFSKLSENIFSGIGEALGSALTGAENPIGGFFLSIGNLLADSIQNLGKYIITTSTLVAKIRSVLNAAFAGNPALGIAVGVGLIAVGSALKSSLPKFADGVRNFGGGLAIVGERGPEVVRLPSGSDVIPNHRINGMAAGEQTVFIADTRISGSDIVLSYTRQTNRNSRNGF